MKRSRCHGPGLAVLGGMVLAMALAACGGKSTAGKPQDPAVLSFQSFVVAFLEGAQAVGIADVDRDFAYCLGPADPVPAGTPPPDASGHTRARMPCYDAGQKVAAALPRYREVVGRLETIAPTNDRRINEARNTLQKVHQTRLQLYEDVSAAVGRRDLEALARLRGRYAQIAELDEAFRNALSALAPQPK